MNIKLYLEILRDTLNRAKEQKSVVLREQRVIENKRAIHVLLPLK